MSIDADDLLLSLMQVADDPEVPAPAPKPTAPSVLSAIKPYPYHKGCKGMVTVTPGIDEEEGPVVMFSCAKCGMQSVVKARPIARKGNTVVADVTQPEWVHEPDTV
jgi:hypothetical protein